MKVDSNNYVQLAVKTEAPITDEMKVRIQKAIPEFLTLMQQQIELGNKLDKIKKFMYYGKGEFKKTSICSNEISVRSIETDVIRLIHSTIGITTEATEMFEALKKHIVEGEVLDKINMKEEFGDAEWYIALGLDTINANLNDTLEININKLAARYPERFTEESAINRNLENERAILES